VSSPPLALPLAAAATVALAGCAAAARTATITVDTTAQFQTMTGWEAVAQAGHEEPTFTVFADTLFDLAVNDLGLNRLRLEVRSGSEHTRDYWVEGRAGTLTGDARRCARYETVNDNDDPRVIAPAGFRFTELDSTVQKVVLPIRRRIEARGERLFLNVTYIAFMDQCPGTARYDHLDAEEYAEFVIAVLTHLRGRWGLVPDTWEAVLEPDNTGRWNPDALGRAIAAAARRLREAGFPTRFIAPSTMVAGRVASWYDRIARAPGAAQAIAEIAYHRYRFVTTGNLRAIAERARASGTATAMLEHIGSGYEDLYEDLTVAGVSAWQQFALAYPQPRDRGGLLYLIDVSDPRRPVIREASRTRFLKPYYRNVRLGARRVGATSEDGAARPVAFLNPGGAAVIVINAARRLTARVIGLPPGRYGATFVTAQDAGTAATDTTLAAGEAMVVRIPARGVVAIVAR